MMTCKIVNTIKKIKRKIFGNPGQFGKTWEELKFYTPYHMIELSEICNARCIFCSYSERVKRGLKPIVMNEDIFEKVLNLIQSTNCRKLEFVPGTGEILVNERWDDYIVKAIVTIPCIPDLKFVTNAILLNEKNQKKLIELILKNKSIQYDIQFSVGGYDRSTYELLFGVDKFDVVCNNINEFLNRLKQIGNINNLNLALIVRRPKYQKSDIPKVNSIYNTANYPDLHIFIPDAVGTIVDLDKHEKILNYCIPARPLEMTNPCAMLYRTMFSARGDIYADGCGNRDLLDDKTLRLGSVYDSIETIEHNRTEIINKWKKTLKLPLVCKDCFMYCYATNKNVSNEH